MHKVNHLFLSLFLPFYFLYFSNRFLVNIVKSAVFTLTFCFLVLSLFLRRWGRSAALIDEHVVASGQDPSKRVEI